MHVVKLVPLAALAVLFGLLVMENRFGYRSPQVAGVTVNAMAAWWKVVLIRWNDHVRYGGLLLLWLGSSAYSIQVRHQPGDANPIILGIAAVGVLAYAWGLAWRKWVFVRDNVLW